LLHSDAASDIELVSSVRSIERHQLLQACGDEQSSPDKTAGTPLSKKRNKHIQHVLVEASKAGRRITTLR
jgi:hypothetical protein